MISPPAPTVRSPHHLPSIRLGSGLRCFWPHCSTGLSPGPRSNDRIAVAAGPDSVERQARAGDPIEALATLASSFEQNDGELAGVPTR